MPAPSTRNFPSAAFDATSTTAFLLAGTAATVGAVLGAATGAEVGAAGAAVGGAAVGAGAGAGAHAATAMIAIKRIARKVVKRATFMGFLPSNNFFSRFNNGKSAYFFCLPPPYVILRF